MNQSRQMIVPLKDSPQKKKKSTNRTPFDAGNNEENESEDFDDEEDGDSENGSSIPGTMKQSYKQSTVRNTQNG